MKKINWYKYLLYVLRGVMYIKRGIIFMWNFITKKFHWLDKIYRITIGFFVYKIILLIKKQFKKISFTKQESRLEFFGRRTTLQIILFVVVFAIMLPHSTLYTKEYNEISGRNSLLFSIIGPGDQDFSFEEISLNLNTPLDTNEQTWKQGAITIDAYTIGDNTKQKTPKDLVSITAGGTALTKPIIMSGIDTGDFADTSDPATTDRSAIVYYAVQPGDVIGKIAEKFGISIQTILWSNNLTIRSYIRPGDELAILPVDGVIYTVKSGDTISKIARTYDATTETIVRYNGISESNIKIGETLIIPGGIKPTTYARPRYIATQPTQFNKVVAPKPSINAPAGTGYLWPTSVSTLTQYFGWRHGGLDIAGPIGSPLYATKSGTVLKSQCGWNWGYGCYVHIDHGNGIQTIYAHASQLFVSAGDYVTQGQNIAAMGSTGNSSGSHIHFEIRVNGKRQNPLAYIRR